MPESPFESSRAPGAATTILVVDDEATVRLVVRRMLADGGYDAFEAPSGEAALGLLEEDANRFGFVITDVVLPGQDGCQRGRRIRARWPATPVLYASAYPPEELFAQGICTDDLPFLRKPFTADELIRRVRELRAA